MLTNLSGAGLDIGSLVTPAGYPRWPAGVPLAMPAERRDSPSGMELAGLGLFLAVAVLVPLLLGLGADSLLHVSPLGLLVGLALGIAAAVAAVATRLGRYR